MSNGELYKLRRSMGLCTLCGTPLEKDGGKYRYACPECRAKKRAYQEKYRSGVRIGEERRAEATRRELAEQAPKKVRDAAPRMRAPEKCQTCVWASYAGGGVWFCPLVGCAKTGRRGA